jgi:LysR family transcriptional regulator, hydrogen peroxide-inducible genes activator
MQMVASGYGVTLLPEIAVDVEVRNERIKLLRFAEPQPQRRVGLAWRPTSPRKADFFALGRVIVGALGGQRPPRRAPRARQDKSRGLALMASAPARSGRGPAS